MMSRASLASPRYATEKSGVMQPHHFAHVAHRLFRELLRLLAAIRNDASHQRRVVEITLGAFTHGLQFREDAVDHGLLAFKTTDAGAAAAFLDPLLASLVR